MPLACAIAPAFVVWVLKVAVWPRAFWHYFFDPEALYVQSGIELLRDGRPLNVDNPGTPVQLLSALGALLSGRSPESIDAIRHLGYVFALLFAVAGCWWLIRAVRRETGDAGAVAVCWAVFAIPQALWRWTIWSPEALFPGLLLFGLGLLWWALSDPTHRRMLVFGGVIGLAVATKFTFLVWVPAAFVAVAFRAGIDRDERVAYCLSLLAGVGAGFLLGTVVVVTRYGEMFRFLLSQGEGGDVTRGAVLSVATAWYGGMLLLFAVGAVLVLSSLESRSEERRVARAVCAGGVALLAFGLISASNLRYLIPSSAALGAWVLGISCMAHRWPRARLLVVPVVLALLARQSWIDVSDHRELIANCELLRERIDAAVDEVGPNDREPVVAYGGRAPHPALALLMYTQTSGERQALAQAVGNAGMYDPRAREVVLPGASRDVDVLVLEQDEFDQLPFTVGTPVRVENPLPNAPYLLVVPRHE